MLVEVCETFLQLTDNGIHKYLTQKAARCVYTEKTKYLRAFNFELKLLGNNLYVKPQGHFDLILTDLKTFKYINSLMKIDIL